MTNLVIAVWCGLTVGVALGAWWAGRKVEELEATVAAAVRILDRAALRDRPPTDAERVEAFLETL